MNIKHYFRRRGLKWHRFLCQAGGVTLLMFAISGLLHPIMTWTGPKAAAFHPPQIKMKAEQIRQIPNILQRHAIERAVMIKVVPSARGALLQVTESSEQARRYFDIETGDELLNYDTTQAIWLARYYLGDNHTINSSSNSSNTPPIHSVTFQAEFDEAYPWVNRLLPVYRVTFDTDNDTDNKVTLFVYTELNALAQITDDWKTSMQSIFRALHTWDWLNDFELSRVLLMSLLLLLLAALAATGLLMLITLKNRSMRRSRQFHRMIGYLIGLPILLYSISGTYHLIQYAYGDHNRGLQLGESKDYSTLTLSRDFSWLETYKEQPVNALSLINGPDHTEEKSHILYRLSLPAGEMSDSVSRSQRFRGVGSESRSIYIDAHSGEISDLSDKAVARHYADQWRAARALSSGEEQVNIVNMQLITHFGPSYDFRNKRLPVWKVEFDTEQADQLFIDPATGMLVDHTSRAERLEGLSFSFLHKWNFLTPLMGRDKRDIVISLIILCAIATTLVGYVMLLRGRKRRAPTLSARANQHKALNHGEFKPRKSA